MREIIVELGVERHDLAADALQQLRREGAGRAIAAGGDDFQLAGELHARGEIVEITRAEILDIAIGAAVGEAEVAGEHDLLEARSSRSGPKVTGRCAPIFTPVQPLSLCEAVTMATAGTSSANCAK